VVVKSNVIEITVTLPPGGGMPRPGPGTPLPESVYVRGQGPDIHIKKKEVG